jgi:hypothetical protein
VPKAFLAIDDDAPDTRSAADGLEGAEGACVRFAKAAVATAIDALAFRVPDGVTWFTIRTLLARSLDRWPSMTTAATLIKCLDLNRFSCFALDFMLLIETDSSSFGDPSSSTPWSSPTRSIAAACGSSHAISAI